MPSQSESAYAKIRENILSTTIPPGTRLTESGLARDFGLGRFAIREALKRLHGERLVTREGSRYQIPIVTPQDAHNVTQLRAILETGALRFMTGSPPRSFLREISEAAADFGVFVRKKYFTGALEADLRFHRSIVAASRNPRLIDAYNAANLPLLQITVGRKPVSLNDFSQSAAEHLAICAALKKNLTSRAAELLEKHLKRGEREILEHGCR